MTVAIVRPVDGCARSATVIALLAVVVSERYPTGRWPVAVVDEPLFVGAPITTTRCVGLDVSPALSRTHNCRSNFPARPKSCVSDAGIGAEPTAENFPSPHDNCQPVIVRPVVAVARRPTVAVVASVEVNASEPTGRRPDTVGTTVGAPPAEVLGTPITTTRCVEFDVSPALSRTQSWTTNFPLRPNSCVREVGIVTPAVWASVPSPHESCQPVIERPGDASPRADTVIDVPVDDVFVMYPTGRAPVDPSLTLTTKSTGFDKRLALSRTHSCAA
jgi:hypothetical protein